MDGTSRPHTHLQGQSRDVSSFGRWVWCDYYQTALVGHVVQCFCDGFVHIYDTFYRRVALGGLGAVFVTFVVVSVDFGVLVAHHHAMEIDAAAVGTYFAEQGGQSQPQNDGHQNAPRLRIK